MNLQGISKASFDEVMAIWKGIELAKEFGFLKLVVVQSDCEPIVGRIMEGTEDICMILFMS